MPLDLVKVSAAVASGVSCVCSTCEHFWRGRDAGLPGSQCTSSRPCGSPIASLAFPEYRGPMQRFDKFCFVCGNASKHAVKVDGQERVTGVCDDHVKLVKTLKPQDGHAPNLVLLSNDGERRVAEDDAPEKKSSVIKFR